MASRGAWAFAIVGVGLAVVSVVGVGSFVLGRSHRADAAPAVPVSPVSTVNVAAKPKPPPATPQPSASAADAPEEAPETPALLPAPEPRHRPPRAIGY